ncbi:MAG: S8 family serine peptidase, partial [Candidatus Thermochlorobacter sp.]
YDGWRVHGGFWTSNQNDYRSLTTPSTADSAICVVGYDVSSGNHDASSSLGLTRNNQLKPEVSAPTNVTTTNGPFGGTSASAPHLAGLGALLLQANPLLSSSQFRALLADSSRRDIATGIIPPHRIDWGYGKMYALGAFQAALPKSGQSVQITRTGNFIWNDLSGKYGAFLNFASEDIDQVTVEIYPNTTPSFIGSAKAVHRRVVITSSGGSGVFNTTLRLYYDDAEVAAGGLSEGNLKLYRFNGSNWELQGGTNNTVDNYVELSGVTAFSEWAIADPSDNPLPVELIRFTGAATSAGVRLSWSTASERNNAGFEILRTVQTPNEPQAWQMIASYAFSPDLRGKGTTTLLTHYAFLDATVEGGKAYTYKLRSRDFNGAMHDYAPRVTVEVRNVSTALPTEYRLEQNYPNPFNHSTIIVYELPKVSQVSLKVYDVMGREVST